MQFGTNGLYYGPIVVHDIMYESDSRNCSISMYLDVVVDDLPTRVGSRVMESPPDFFWKIRKPDKAL